jgi:formylglycine-generating enzyme required for sulfatase activity
VPTGEFLMGSDSGEAYSEEKPVHRVALDGFWMEKYEVTQGEWGQIMGRIPSLASRFIKGDRYPVGAVSWLMAQDFIKKFNARTNQKFRLPTEAEWEYACRAGTTTPFHYGGSLSPDQANFNGDFPYGGAAKGAYRRKTVPVGSFAANAWGLHDMHGNLWEWCADWYDSGYYEKAPLEYPAGPDGGTSRVLRGGSWNLHGDSCRSAHRGGYPPKYACSLFGFRVVVLPAQGE